MPPVPMLRERSEGPVLLAEKLNIVLLIDQRPRQRGKVRHRFMVDDEAPRQYIDRLPKGPHWRVHRAITQPRLIPRDCI